jgi:hypothetical protein
MNGGSVSASQNKVKQQGLKQPKQTKQDVDHKMEKVRCIVEVVVI